MNKDGAFPCAACGSRKGWVVDSRPSSDGGHIWRRRECSQCGHRFTTREYIENGREITSARLLRLVEVAVSALEPVRAGLIKLTEAEPKSPGEVTE